MSEEHWRPGLFLFTSTLLHQVTTAITRFYSLKCSPAAWKRLAQHAILGSVSHVFKGFDSRLESQTCPPLERSICVLDCTERGFTRYEAMYRVPSYSQSVSMASCRWTFDDFQDFRIFWAWSS